MRSQLMPFLGCKYRFSGTVKRFGMKNMPYSGRAPTLMLKGLVLHTSIEVPVDHAWATVGKRLADFNPRIGDVVSFNAWVREYHKFDRNQDDWKLDYCINRLSGLELLEAGDGETFTAFWGRVLNSGMFVTRAFDQHVAVSI